MTSYVLYHNTLCISTFGKEILYYNVRCSSHSNKMKFFMKISLCHLCTNYVTLFIEPFLDSSALNTQLSWFYFETSAKFLWSLFLFVLFPLNPLSHLNLLSLISEIHQSRFLLCFSRMLTSNASWMLFLRYITFLSFITFIYSLKSLFCPWQFMGNNTHYSCGTL